MNLRFLGAAGEVTGSCYLVATGALKFLVDCGMFQGGGSAERKNRRFAFKPRDIAFVLLSHAHIDHSGLLVESTYGDRNHKSLVQTLDEFAFALNDTLASRRGNVVIPSFAVGRTQEILYYVAQLRRQWRIPAADVYVDSPMASAATRITLRHAQLPDLDRVRFTDTLEESMRINGVRAGAIIVSASGMCEGGRIRHHLRYNISRPECAVVFVGFQAAGTLGRRIVDGAKSVRIFRENYPVRAKLFTINGLSAHADRDALLGWIGQFRHPPGQTWVVHGEPLAAEALKNSIIDGFGWRAAVPVADQVVAL